MTQHALYVGGDYVPVTCGYRWNAPKVQRVGQTEYTPYGLAWDNGVDELSRVQLRAEASSLELWVGGTDAVAAAEAAEYWTQLVLVSTRLQFIPTGRFMRVLLARSVGEREVVRGTSYRFAFSLEYVDPYWHEDDLDASTRLNP